MNNPQEITDKFGRFCASSIIKGSKPKSWYPACLTFETLPTVSFLPKVTAQLLTKNSSSLSQTWHVKYSYLPATWRIFQFSWPTIQWLHPMRYFSLPLKNVYHYPHKYMRHTMCSSQLSTDYWRTIYLQGTLEKKQVMAHLTVGTGKSGCP